MTCTYVHGRLVLAQRQEEAGLDEHLAVSGEEGLAATAAAHQTRQLSTHAAAARYTHVCTTPRT